MSWKPCVAKHLFRNKAVMNSTPELPMLFLLNQLVLAVVLLHISALFSKKIEIPKLDLKTAKKLTPVTLVNVIGLIFNILCLRGVEASFFQVRSMEIFSLTITLLISLYDPDCAWPRPAAYYCHILSRNTHGSLTKSFPCRRRGDLGLLTWRIAAHVDQHSMAFSA